MFTARPTSIQSATPVAPPRRRRATRFVALLATATVGAVCMNTAAASADTISSEHRVFQLKNAYGGNVADVPDSTTVSGTPIIQWPSHQGANQRFFFEPRVWLGTTTTVYRIRNQATNQCLQPYGLLGGDIKVVQSTCRDYDMQQWELRRSYNGYYLIKNWYTKTYMHVRNKTAGSELSLTDEFGETDRRWALNETKVSYSVDTPGITVPWGALGYNETGYCDDGWHVELDAGTWSPRYNSIGDAGVKTTGKIFRTSGGFDDLLGYEHNPRKVQFNYYQNSGTDSSRNYALTGRTRFYCQPGSDW